MVESANYYFDKYFHVLTTFVVLLVMLFYSADRVLGAVGLRAFYTPVGMGFGMLCLFWLVLVIRHQKMSSKSKLTYALTVLCLIGGAVLVGTLTHLIYLLVVVGWFTGIVTGALFIPAYAIAIVIAGILVTQIILTLGNRQSLIRKGISLALLLYMAGFSIGFASLPPYAESTIDEKRVQDNHQYFLYIWYGWLGDPDTLELYECNAFGIFCGVVYEAPTGHYTPSTASIEFDPNTNKMGVRIDDRLSPWQLNQEDVVYLCDFFDVPSQDRFCVDPYNQDYSSFWWMLRRNIDDDLNYDNVVPYFEQTANFDATTCPSGEIFLSGDQKSYTCHLPFPDSKLFLELYMTRSTYDDKVWYDVRLVNPECNCDNAKRY
jgi:hypothetical protein